MKVAVLDLYEGVPNEGMRCIRELLMQFAESRQIPLQLNEFDVRGACSVPDLGYDVYISSGGPGSPVDSAGSDWETAYFGWLQSVLDWNLQDGRPKNTFSSFAIRSRSYAAILN